MNILEQSNNEQENICKPSVLMKDFKDARSKNELSISKTWNNVLGLT